MTNSSASPRGAGRWYLVCYDIREPRRLRRVATMLEGHGERIQYSVFRCWLSASALERLRWELTADCVTEDDDVLFIPLCSRCVEGIRVTHSTLKDSAWGKRHTRVRVL